MGERVLITDGAVDVREIGVRQLRSKLFCSTTCPLVLGVIITSVFSLVMLSEKLLVWEVGVRQASILEEQSSIAGLALDKASFATSYMNRIHTELAVSSYTFAKVAASDSVEDGLRVNVALNQGPGTADDTMGHIKEAGVEGEEVPQPQVPGWHQACLPASTKDSQNCAEKTAYFTSAGSAWLKRLDADIGGKPNKEGATDVTRFHTYFGETFPLEQADQYVNNVSSSLDVAWYAVSAARHGRVSSDASCFSTKEGCDVLQMYVGMANGQWRENLANQGGWQRTWQAEGEASAYGKAATPAGTDLCKTGSYGYDPRCRPWYYYAQKKKSTQYSGAPYVFSSTSALGSSVSIAIFNTTGSQQYPVGVASMDFSVTVLQNVVTKSTVKLTGWGLVIALSEGFEGNTVVSQLCVDQSADAWPADKHAFQQTKCPGDDEEQVKEKWRAADKDSNKDELDAKATEQQKAFKDTVVAAMLKGEVGVQTYKNGTEDEVWYAAYAPIRALQVNNKLNDPSLLETQLSDMFSATLLVPEADVLAPFMAVKAFMDRTIGTAWAVVIIIIAFVTMCAIQVTRLIANRICVPVLDLLDLTRAISARKFSHDADSLRSQKGTTFREVDALISVYEKMFTVVRLGNASYFANDLGAATQLIDEAASLFKSLNDRSGMGVTDNNRGAILYAAGDHAGAAQFFRRSAASVHAALIAFDNDDDPAAVLASGILADQESQSYVFTFPQFFSKEADEPDLTGSDPLHGLNRMNSSISTIDWDNDADIEAAQNSMSVRAISMCISSVNGELVDKLSEQYANRLYNLIRVLVDFETVQLMGPDVLPSGTALSKVQFAEDDETIQLLLQLLSCDLMTGAKPRRVMEVAGLLAMCYSRQNKTKQAQLYIQLARGIPDQLKTDPNFTAAHPLALEHFEIIEAQSVLIEAGYLSGQGRHDDAIDLLSKHLTATKQLQFEGTPFVIAIRRELILSGCTQTDVLQAMDDELSAPESGGTVDIAFVMDGTASMGDQMTAAKQKTTSIISQLREEFPDKKFRIGFVLYRDRGCDPTPIISHPFTSDSAAVTKFIRPLEPMSFKPLDQPEDIVGGFEAVLKLNWEADTRVLIHFADAPCHGSKYHVCRDNHPDGVPGQPKPEELLKAMVNRKIIYRFCEFNSSTSQMCRLFKTVYDAECRKQNWEAEMEHIQMLDTSPDFFAKTVSAFVAAAFNERSQGIQLESLDF